MQVGQADFALLLHLTHRHGHGPCNLGDFTYVRNLRYIHMWSISASCGTTCHLIKYINLLMLKYNTVFCFPLLSSFISWSMMQTDHVGGRVWAVGFSTKCSKDQTALYNTNNAIKRECKKGCIACGMRHWLGIVMPFAVVVCLPGRK